MHGLLTPAARARHPLAEFRAATTARRRHGHRYGRSIPDDPDGVDGDTVTVPVVVETRVFGACAAT